MPVKMKISDVVVHPKFVNVNGYDIALLKLEKSVNFTENIQPINLPRKSKFLTNSTLFVAGFGNTKNASQSMLYLRYVKMKQITNDECGSYWGWKITDTLLCGLGKNNFNHTTCIGDSGSGIIEKNGNSSTLLGIVSYGPPGCLGKPKVFTRVTSYLNFIRSVTKIDIQDWGEIK